MGWKRRYSVNQAAKKTDKRERILVSSSTLDEEFEVCYFISLENFKESSFPFFLILFTINQL